MLLKQIKYLIVKELSLELKQKYALNSILLYVISTVFISYLSFKSVLQPSAWNALFWIIMLFSSVNAINKSFLIENKRRHLYLYTLVSAQAIIISKIIYNILLMMIISVICLGFYMLFLGNLVQNMPLFFAVLLFGSAGFSSLLTMVSAIASKTNNNFSMMAILSFPIMIPLLITIIKVSKNAVDGLSFSLSSSYLAVFFVRNLIVVLLSYLLFPYLWKD